MGTILTLIFSLLVLLIFIIASGYFWQWFYSTETGHDETFFLKAADGWRIAVHHYLSENPPWGYPIILCHGLSSNRYSFDLPDAPSLAKYLKNKGLDVWVAELRGAGMSQSPGLYAADVPYSWDFEDHFRLDMPPIIDFVLKKTGASKIAWIGHSMGGLLILAHLAKNHDSPVACAVAIGSPADFSKIRSKCYDFLLSIKPFLEKLPICPITILAKFVTPIVHLLPGFLMGVFHTPNVQPKVARTLIALASQLVTSNKIWLNFGRFLETGRFEDPSGKPYLENLPSSQVPILFLGGTADIMAPEEAVAAACKSTEQTGRRECLIFGKKTGYAEDYGHMDLLVGTRVEYEVFPKVAEFIEEHNHP